VCEAAREIGGLKANNLSQSRRDAKKIKTL
jgi:hypothetical protein